MIRGILYVDVPLLNGVYQFCAKLILRYLKNLLQRKLFFPGSPCGAFAHKKCAMNEYACRNNVTGSSAIKQYLFLMNISPLCG